MLSSTTGRGRRHLAIAMQLMIHLHSRLDFSLSSSVWWSALVPKHAVCLYTPKGCDKAESIGFSLEVTEHGVMFWPVSRCGTLSLKLDWGGRPFVKFIFDPEEIDVVPTSVISALHSSLKGDIPAIHRGIMASHTAKMPLLEYQAKHGFSGVAEQWLRKLLIVKKSGYA